MTIRELKLSLIDIQGMKKKYFENARSVALYTYLNYKNMQDVTKGALFFHTKTSNSRMAERKSNNNNWESYIL